MTLNKGVPVGKIFDPFLSREKKKRKRLRNCQIKRERKKEANKPLITHTLLLRGLLLLKFAF